MVRSLPKGIYTPLPTFFQDGSEDLDIPAFKKHIQCKLYTINPYTWTILTPPSHSKSRNLPRNLWNSGRSSPSSPPLSPPSQSPKLIPLQSHQERTALIVAGREALDSINLTTIPIVAGIGATSTRESIQLAKEATAAGADFAIAIPPGYYAGALKANDSVAIKNFFVDVAEGSPIPV